MSGEASVPRHPRGVGRVIRHRVEGLLQALRGHDAVASQDPVGLVGLVREHVRHRKAVALVERQATHALLVVREAGNYQQRVRRLAFYERNGFTVTNMLTHEADQTYRVLARDGIVSPQRLEEALNSVTDDPAYASRVTTD